MLAIAICLDRRLGRYVGGFRILDDNGIGTDEVLFCETPIRATRTRAITDALAVLAALG